MYIYAQLEIEYNYGNLVPLFLVNLLANINGIKANQMIVIVHIMHNWMYLAFFIINILSLYILEFFNLIAKSVEFNVIIVSKIIIGQQLR